MFIIVCQLVYLHTLSNHAPAAQTVGLNIARKDYFEVLCSGMNPTLFVVMQQHIKSQLLCQLSYAPQLFSVIDLREADGAAPPGTFTKLSHRLVQPAAWHRPRRPCSRCGCGRILPASCGRLWPPI